jgi:hypothetical protein
MKYQKYARIKEQSGMKRKFNGRLAVDVGTQIKEKSLCE